MYGIRHLFLEVENNACRMTYMFGVPQFSVSSHIYNDANKFVTTYSILSIFLRKWISMRTPNIPIMASTTTMKGEYFRMSIV